MPHRATVGEGRAQTSSSGGDRWPRAHQFARQLHPRRQVDPGRDARGLFHSTKNPSVRCVNRHNHVCVWGVITVQQLAPSTATVVSGVPILVSPPILICPFSFLQTLAGLCVSKYYPSIKSVLIKFPIQAWPCCNLQFSQCDSIPMQVSNLYINELMTG